MSPKKVRKASSKKRKKKAEEPWDREFYRVVDHAQALKVKDTDREKAVRLYCTQSYGGGQWSLQVRSPVSLRTGGEGKDFIVAVASLDKDAMVGLRDAIDRFLGELQ